MRTEMVVYKITANGVTHYTKTGISIWKAVLDKFNIKYEIERTNDNDIPHSVGWNPKGCTKKNLENQISQVLVEVIHIIILISTMNGINP